MSEPESQTRTSSAGRSKSEDRGSPRFDLAAEQIFDSCKEFDLGCQMSRKENVGRSESGEAKLIQIIVVL